MNGLLAMSIFLFMHGRPIGFIRFGEKHTELLDEEDGFYYDVLNLPSGSQLKLKVRSLVGLIPQADYLAGTLTGVNQFGCL
jgi:hypothetical protein